MQWLPPAEPPWKTVYQPMPQRTGRLAHTEKLGYLVHNRSAVCSDRELWRSLVTLYGILELLLTKMGI